METAETLVNDILQELLINAAEQSVQPIDFQTALRYLNRWMAQKLAGGIDLGYVTLVNPADVVTFSNTITNSAGAINGIIYNVALQLSTTYDVIVTPELAVKAKAGLNVMIKLGSPILNTHYTSNTPRGSGDYHGHSRDAFYTGCNEDDAATCVVSE